MATALWVGWLIMASAFCVRRLGGSRIVRRMSLK